MKYRKKPLEVDAFLFTEDVEINAPKWFVNALSRCRADIDMALQDGHCRIYGCTIYSKRGRLKARVGDYIIKGTHGEWC